MATVALALVLTAVYVFGDPPARVDALAVVQLAWLFVLAAVSDWAWRGKKNPLDRP